jgi:transcriptional regulator with XRE-family HTH domain
MAPKRSPSERSSAEPRPTRGGRGRDGPPASSAATSAESPRGSKRRSKPDPAKRDDGLEQIVTSIGPKLRELRMQRGMSLQQLAERADVSTAAIHKIERAGMVPTITTLLKIAAALNRPVSYFVEEELTESRPVTYVPANARRRVFTAHQGIDLAGISGPYGRFFLAGALATLDPGANSGTRAMEHPGEELLYVLEGVIAFDVDGDRYTLSAGDALHFRTDRPHFWSNPGKKPAHAVWLALRPF